MINLCFVGRILSSQNDTNRFRALKCIPSQKRTTRVHRRNKEQDPSHYRGERRVAYRHRKNDKRRIPSRTALHLRGLARERVDLGLPILAPEAAYRRHLRELHIVKEFVKEKSAGSSGQAVCKNTRATFHLSSLRIPLASEARTSVGTCQIAEDRRIRGFLGLGLEASRQRRRDGSKSRTTW